MNLSNTVGLTKNKPACLGGSPIFENVLPITKPTLPDFNTLESKYKEVFNSGMITNAKYVREFEAKAAEYLGSKHVIALNSCTSGLMLVMRAFELTGEVILPSFTFHATAHASVWNSLTPVLIDCDPQTYNIDINQTRKAITKNTSAIIAVHMFGNPNQIEELEALAKEKNLKLIFDAAHAFGSVYRGKKIGLFGDAESFSLSPTKLVTSGEGGLVSTQNDELARKLRIARNYGDPGTYDCEFNGLSARMSELNAILGCASLDLIDENINQRQHLVGLYKELLKNIEGITFQLIESGNRSTYKDFSILINSEKLGLSRDALHDAFVAENIMVKKYFYPPVHDQKIFKQYADQNKLTLKITEEVSYNSLSLPLFSHMTEEEVRKVCQAFCNIVAHKDEIEA